MSQVQPLRTVPVGAFSETLTTTAQNVDVYVLLIDRATGHAHVLAGGCNAGPLVVERGRGAELLAAGSELRMDGRPRIVTDAP